MELAVLIGIPATGKTRFANDLLGRSHLRLSRDVLGTRSREHALLEAGLSVGANIVIDDTNVTRDVRSDFIGPAHDHGYRVVGFYFRSELAKAQERNATRPDAERVPPAGLGDKWKRLELPSLEEGFDELRYVKIGSDGDFEIEEWLDAP